MRWVVAACVLTLLPSCTRATVQPSILDSVRCERNEAADALAGLDRWDERVAAFERADGEDPPSPGAVVFIGSSSVVRWGTVGEDMAPLPAINRGFGGSATRQATHYVDRLVLPYDPRAVVLYEGDNDIAFGITADCVLRDMEAFVASVHRGRPGLPVYVLAVKPSLARAHLWEEYLRANQLITAWAERTPGVTFIDVATPMFGEDGRLREDLFVEDGLHMNAQGYEVWTDAVRPVLQGDLL